MAYVYIRASTKKEIRFSMRITGNLKYSVCINQNFGVEKLQTSFHFIKYYKKIRRARSMKLFSTCCILFARRDKKIKHVIESSTVCRIICQ